MDSTTQQSQQQSTFGAAFRKVADVVGHYVEFSDQSSSWSGSQSDQEGAETPTQHEDLRTPLLHSQPVEAEDSIDTSDHSSPSASLDAFSQKSCPDQAPVASEQPTAVVTNPEVDTSSAKPASASSAPEQRADPDTSSSPAVLEHDTSAAELAQTPVQEEVHSTADESQSKIDAPQAGTETPAREDVRSTYVNSQPEETAIVSSVQSDSPKVPPSGGMHNLGSGLLDPSLLEQLLDDHAPPPDMPGTPIQHVVPVNAQENPDLESAGHPALKSHGSGWILTTFVMVAEMFGLGILTLPADFARLGWAVGLGLVLLFCLGTMYSGLLFSQLGAKVPTARVYEDFAAAALGKHGRWLVYGTVYMVILLDPIIFHLTATQSLQAIFYQKHIPFWLAGLIVSVIMLPLSQLQDIGEVAVISIIGTVGMLAAVVIATLKLLMMDVKGAEHEAVHSDGFNVAVVALMDIVFTYGGQQNWLRYIGGMRKKSDFRYSATVGSIFMTTFYVILGGVGYWKMGVHFDHSKPITSVLPEDLWTSVMNIGLFAHCIIAYQIDLNVWTDLILDFTAKKSPTTSKSPRHQKVLWLLVSIIGIVFAATMAYLLPFFSTIMGLIAAVGDLSAAYALPALFCLCLMRREMPLWERVLCYLLVPLSLLLSVFGIYSSVYQLILQFAGRI